MGGDKYFFEDVKLKTLNNGRIVLEGIFVKKTTLEVKSEYDYKFGLTFTNKLYDSAPISIFTLFLDNHRILYTMNQKGSPNIRIFSATIKYMVKKQIQGYNKNRTKDERIQYPAIDVVNIPVESSITERLSNVKKIKKVTFRFFNPNGDFKTEDGYNWIFEELEEMGSKSGVISYNSPTKFKNVSKRIAASDGKAAVNLEVVYRNDSKGRLDNGTMTENFDFELPDGSSIETVAKIAMDSVKENEIISKIGEENKKIFEENIKSIESLT